ncbi:MAG: hypothetical protein COV70_03535 [Parcubacteria group bacterium CG11_big_fil_rev_8_21_14_0_20_39_22]|nr:MAG: hypothetical protein COV70_03535 [Parcubacteria group bacterium CG11_big_fil_rev_8_21_14_0_20_39_22]
MEPFPSSVDSKCSLPFAGKHGRQECLTEGGQRGKSNKVKKRKPCREKVEESKKYRGHGI